MAAFNFFNKQAAKPAAKSAAGAASTEPVADPMKAFEGMWAALAEQQKAAATNRPGIPMLDAAQLATALSKTRIAPQVKPEHLEAITSGGEGALAAMAEMLNQTAQASTAQAILASQRMVQAAVESTQQAFQADLPNQLRDQLFQQQLAAKLPNLSNPAVAPMVEMVRAGIAASNPSLTPEQLTEQAAQFFTEFSKGLPGAAASNAPTAEETPVTDWRSVFGLSDPSTTAAAQESDVGSAI